MFGVLIRRIATPNVIIVVMGVPGALTGLKEGKTSCAVVCLITAATMFDDSSVVRSDVIVP